METLNYMSDGDGRKYLTMKCMTGFWYRRPIRERAGSKPTRIILDWLMLQHIGPNPDFVRKCHTKGILTMLSLYKRIGHILEAVYKHKLRRRYSSRAFWNIQICRDFYAKHSILRKERI